MIKEAEQYYFLSGMHLAGEDKLTDAIHYLEMAVSLNSSNTDTLNLLGICHYGTGNYIQARRFWEVSNNVSADDNPVSHYLSELADNEFIKYETRLRQALEAAERGKYKKALKLLNHKIFKNKRTVIYRNIKGLCLYETGRRKRAARQWVKALQIDKSNKAALKYIENGV